MNDIEPAAGPAVDTVAIGASAGGLHPLRTIVSGLSADFPAAILVVLHVSANGTSVLPQILARATAMEVLPAEDGLELRPGRVVVAPPDRHVIVEDGRVQLSRGPRENGHRPAIDPLMRSVAEQRGVTGAGVILSGTRDDGTQGIAEIRRRGGATVVQDPDEAEYPGMPANAIGSGAVDRVLPAAAIAPVLWELTRGPSPRRAAQDAKAFFVIGDDPLKITCPECGGVLTETDDAGVVHFRCHVGHAFSPRSLLSEHAQGVERAMWTAARSLEDRAALLLRLADRARRAGNVKSADQFEGNAAGARREAQAIRDAIGALDDSYVAEATNGREATA